MEAVNTKETSLNFYETTRRNIPENSHLHTRRRENLKSRTVITRNRRPKLDALVFESQRNTPAHSTQPVLSAFTLNSKAAS
jgi:hypothetical protein